MSWRRFAAVVGLLLAMVLSPLGTASAAGETVLPVPFRSQFDGTEWGSSNCGPTSIAMVLQAYNVDVPTQTLRNRANRLLGIADPSTGTRSRIWPVS